MKKKLFFLLFITIFTQGCLIDLPESQENDLSITPPPVVNLKTNSIIEEDLLCNEKLSLKNEIDKSQIDSLMIKNSKTKAIIRSKTVHIAFTDLIKYNDLWYLSFRFADGHVPQRFAYIVIYKSNDLEEWKFEQIFTQEGYDLRDPKLFIHKDSLFLHFHSTSISSYGKIRNDYISKFDIEKSNWLTSKKLNKSEDLQSWFWRISSINNQLYVGAYSQNGLFIFNSTNNIDYQKIYTFDISDQLSESTFREKDSILYALMRVNSQNMILGKSNINSINKWDFKELPWNNIGGPNFLIYRNYLIIGGRKNAKTALYKYNLNNNVLSLLGETREIKYDSGYPGMYIENNFLYFTYYSTTHDNEFQINLSIIDLDKIL